MQCSCGGDATTRVAEKTKLKAALSFYECKSCGRVSDAVLTIGDIEVARDMGGKAHGRSAFNTLDADSAHALRAEAEKVQASVAGQSEDSLQAMFEF